MRADKGRHGISEAPFDIAVVGGGAAGTMAAITAARLGRRVALLERNDSIGRKILVTGKGRCNLTNSADIDVFIRSFGRHGEFLRTAFKEFSNDDLVGFFRAGGLETKIERQGRVFPVTDSARSVVEFLEKALRESGVSVIYGFRLSRILAADGAFSLESEGRAPVEALKVILATGGGSYRDTGSSGDGFRIAKELGHSIAPITAALVPLTVREAWVKALQGLGLENIRITFRALKKKIVSDVGELMFTHFGISGPLVLDLSAEVLAMRDAGTEVTAFIDLKPGMTEKDLEKRLLKDFVKKGKAKFRNVMKDYLPKRMVDIFVELSGVAPDREANQLTQADRRGIIRLFKALPLTVSGSLAVEEAMVTGGGVSTREIDPRTMESRVIRGLYLAGELIDGAAPSGGFNLQQAFSTGYLAGMKASQATGG
jgi:predicted Rossmann fold flavoprotein